MATPFVIPPLPSRLAFRASQLFQKDAFVCRRCMHQQSKQPHAFRSTRRTPFLDAFRQPRRSVQSRWQSSSPTAQSSSISSPLGALSQSISRDARPSHSSTTSSSSWPETSHKSVAYWLLGSAASVFGIVVFGGLTRLTESGLSITEWRPVTGSLPPTGEQAWAEEFARYKLSPEFKMLNSRMDLEEFKQIYWMEWTHRLWGRVVGITFLLPTLYFVVRRRVSRHMALKLGGICGLIGFQGIIGWWMVKSGLKDDLFAQGQHPRVSQYRLAAHLGTAFLAYLAMLWNGLSILRAHRLLQNPAEGAKLLEQLRHPSLRPFKRSVAALSILIFTTAMSGALVAGLDAGLIYNDFPWMGQGIIPPKREMLDPFYSHTPSPHPDLLWRNALENPVLVQLDHRILATTTFTAVIALWAYSRFNPRVRATLPKEAQKAALGLVHLVSLQVVLGISTLWYLVPTPLAAAHQAGALALLTGVAVLGRRVFVSKRTLQTVQKALERQGSALGKGAVQRHWTPPAGTH
ncbi:Cytochrome c oxidase assembly protein cox15 [Vermiconidia calcicola]|uniref:Cytochrome c oxidase assembly protein cox15 n=1 Tax=Vermiconidia calcicola TaxID=1690605 RepID=A0ACC3N2E3_9PEZI|nr:Cytochrome c oxidase assembly protein cox15 [Vermiconidia calcicola]